MKRQSVVILHGWGLSAKRFAPLKGELRKRDTAVYCPDLPGFGTAKIPDAPLTLSDYAAFVRTYIKQHHIQRPVIIGHSFGGRVALKYQELYPGEIASLILTGTPGFSPIAKSKLTAFILLAKLGKLFFSLPGLSLLQEKVRLFYYQLVGARDFYRAQGAMRETFKIIVREDLRKSMQAVRVPCLLLWGAEDHIVPVAIAKRMHECIPSSKLEVISGADHGVPFKQPKLFCNRVDTFLHTA